MIVSHTQRQSNELMGKAEGFLRMLDLRVRGDGKNAHSLQFPNGSRIVALPGKARNIRAFSATMLLVDEAARVDDEVYDAVRPMLAATDGELWMMSTPDGRRGFFYDEWVNGTEPWLRIMAKATDCPRYSARFLERSDGGVSGSSGRSIYANSSGIPGRCSMKLRYAGASLTIPRCSIRRRACFGDRRAAMLTSGTGLGTETGFLGDCVVGDCREDA